MSAAGVWACPPPQWPKGPPHEIDQQAFRGSKPDAAVDRLESWSLLPGQRWVVCRRVNDLVEENWLALHDERHEFESHGMGAVAFDLQSRGLRYLAPRAESRDDHYAYRCEIISVAPWRTDRCVVATRWVARQHDTKGALLKAVSVQPESELWQWSMTGEIRSLGSDPRRPEQLGSLLNLACVVDAYGNYNLSWQLDDKSHAMTLSLAEHDKRTITIECRPGHWWAFTAVEGVGGMLGIESAADTFWRHCVGIRRFPGRAPRSQGWTIPEAEIQRQLGDKVYLGPTPGGKFPESRVPLAGYTLSERVMNQSDTDCGLCYLDCLNKTVSVAPIEPARSRYLVPRSFFSRPDGKTLFNVRGSPGVWEKLYVLTTDHFELQQTVALDPGSTPLNVLGMTSNGAILLQRSTDWCDELWLLESPFGKTRPVCICDGALSLGQAHISKPPPIRGGGGMF